MAAMASTDSVMILSSSCDLPIPMLTTILVTRGTDITLVCPNSVISVGAISSLYLCSSLAAILLSQ
jgi:predicted transcriptional regulator